MSGIATGTAIAIAAGVGAAGSIGSAAIGANAAGNAAGAQESAAQQALKTSQGNLAAGISQVGQSEQAALAAQQPYAAAGQSALTNLNQLMAPGGDLYKQWDQTFQAPTAAQAAATPGYQFALQQGLQGINNSAAARGTVMNPGTAKGLAQYAQGLASNTYQQTFNNQLTAYQQAYQQFQQGQSNLYNRLAGIVGTGQTAANQIQAGQMQGAGLMANLYGNQSNQAANILGYQGNAAASGAINQANAWSGGLNNLGNYAMLGANLYGQNQPQGLSTPWNTGNENPTYMGSPPIVAPTSATGALGTYPGQMTNFNQSGYSPTAPTIFNSVP